MNEAQVAIYASVSSEQQSEAKTIESQLSELRAQVKAFGLVLTPEHEFVDNGYSGSTLIRPAFGKTSGEPLGPRLRAQRGRPMQPKRAVCTHDVPQEKWMSIAVPCRDARRT